MKARGVPRGLPVTDEVCGKCGTAYKVRWIAIATSHYTFSGYLCEECEPKTGAMKDANEGLA